jgi:hypothetical protein
LYGTFRFKNLIVLMLTKFHTKKNNKLCNWLVFHQPLHILPNNNRVELIKLFTFHFKTIF